MADTGPINVSELQNQLTDLKAEILEISRALSARASDVADEARPLIEEAGTRLRDAAGSARAQGRAVVDTVKQNPGTATSIALTAGLLGLAIGYFVGSASASGSRSRW